MVRGSGRTDRHDAVYEAGQPTLRALDELPVGQGVFRTGANYQIPATPLHQAVPSLAKGDKTAIAEGIQAVGQAEKEVDVLYKNA